MLLTTAGTLEFRDNAELIRVARRAPSVARSGGRYVGCAAEANHYRCR